MGCTKSTVVATEKKQEVASDPSSQSSLSNNSFFSVHNLYQEATNLCRQEWDAIINTNFVKNDIEKVQKEELMYGNINSTPRAFNYPRSSFEVAERNTEEEPSIPPPDPEHRESPTSQDTPGPPASSERKMNMPPTPTPKTSDKYPHITRGDTSTLVYCSPCLLKRHENKYEMMLFADQLNGNFSDEPRRNHDSSSLTKSSSIADQPPSGGLSEVLGGCDMNSVSGAASDGGGRGSPTLAILKNTRYGEVCLAWIFCTVLPNSVVSSYLGRCKADSLADTSTLPNYGSAHSLPFVLALRNIFDGNKKSFPNALSHASGALTMGNCLYLGIMKTWKLPLKYKTEANKYAKEEVGGRKITVEGSTSFSSIMEACERQVRRNRIFSARHEGLLKCIGCEYYDPPLQKEEENEKSSKRKGKGGDGDDGHFFRVYTDFCPFGSLQWCKANGQLENHSLHGGLLEHTARALMYEVLLTLRYLHRENELQYEITTKNIFIKKSMMRVYKTLSPTQLGDEHDGNTHVEYTTNSTIETSSLRERIPSLSFASSSSLSSQDDTKLSIAPNLPFNIEYKPLLALEVPVDPIFSETLSPRSLESGSSLTECFREIPPSEKVGMEGSMVREISPAIMSKWSAIPPPIVVYPIQDAPMGGICIQVEHKFSGPLVGYSGKSHWNCQTQFFWRNDTVEESKDVSALKKASLRRRKASSSNCNLSRNRRNIHPQTNAERNSPRDYPHAESPPATDSSAYPELQRKEEEVTNYLDPSWISPTKRRKHLEWRSWPMYVRDEGVSMVYPENSPFGFNRKMRDSLEDKTVASNESLLNFFIKNYSFSKRITNTNRETCSSDDNPKVKRSPYDAVCPPYNVNRPFLVGKSETTPLLSLPMTSLSPSTTLPFSVTQAFIPNLPPPMILHNTKNMRAPVSDRCFYKDSPRFVTRLQHDALLRKELMKLSALCGHCRNVSTVSNSSGNLTPRSGVGSHLIAPSSSFPRTCGSSTPLKTKKLIAMKPLKTSSTLSISQGPSKESKGNLSNMTNSNNTLNNSFAVPLNYFIPPERYITPDHLAPEVLLKHEFSEASDIYAWAITFIETVSRNNIGTQRDCTSDFSYSESMLRSLGISFTCLPECLPDFPTDSASSQRSSPILPYPPSLMSTQCKNWTPAVATCSEEEFLTKWACKLRQYYQEKIQEETERREKWEKEEAMLSSNEPGSHHVTGSTLEQSSKCVINFKRIMQGGGSGWCGNPTARVTIPSNPECLDITVRRPTQNGLLSLYPVAVPIPDYLSENCRAMLQWCLQLNPSCRPSASELLTSYYFQKELPLFGKDF